MLVSPRTKKRLIKANSQIPYQGGGARGRGDKSCRGPIVGPLGTRPSFRAERAVLVLEMEQRLRARYCCTVYLSHMLLLLLLRCCSVHASTLLFHTLFRSSLNRLRDMVGGPAREVSCNCVPETRVLKKIQYYSAITDPRFP